MQRVRTQDFAHRARICFNRIPRRVREIIGPVHLFEGDPYFAGIYSPVSPHHTSNLEVRDIHYPPPRVWGAACWWPVHLRDNYADRRCTTITFFERPPVAPVFIHEMGHALMFALGSTGDDWGWPHGRKARLPQVLRGLTEYQPDSYTEQFAESFSLWLCRPHDILVRGERYRGRAEVFMRESADLLAFFNGLAGYRAGLPPVSLRGR